MVDVDKLQKIADTYGLKLLYDAAHAFGVKFKGESILNCGDLSMLSFHATKTFNTAEGGALITGDKKLKTRIDYLKNFGFADEVTVTAPGTNGKMNELQAALGLVQLRHVDGEIKKRREVITRYKNNLADIPGIKFWEPPPNATSNGSYFPIFVDEQEYRIHRDALCNKLKKDGIFARRYFYPLISDFPSYRDLPSAQELSVARKIASEVLCLPIYASLQLDVVDRICELIAK